MSLSSATAWRHSDRGNHLTLPIFALLTASPDVVTLLREGAIIKAFRAGKAPQDVRPPYVTWSIVADPPVQTMDGAGMDHFRVQVNCFAVDEEQCVALDNAVMRAIEKDGENASLGLSIDDTDPPTGLYRRSRDFSLWMPR